ncbi:SIMPL domain-containing protein OS=Ureibacillus acetophenoni OX=614649 GN=SAMN05877842_102300 PE=4 SV=1 [Ureibacillus acetophenoni]
MEYFNNRPTKPKSRVITVNGNGEISVAPNYAEIRIEVVKQSKDLGEAQSQNAQVMNQVISALLSLGISRDDIQTSAFNIFPQYDYIEGRQVFRGYEVSNSLTVKIRDISKVGLVIDTAVKNGANRISSLEFKLEQENKYYQQALQLALYNAVEKARVIAETLRLPIHPLPIEIVEESVESPPIMYRAVAMSQESFQTPIEQGTISINAKVLVKFEF